MVHLLKLFFILNIAHALVPRLRFSPLKSSSRLHSDTSDTMSLIEGNYKKVFVAGGTKGVGRSVVSLLTRSGVSVVALARSQTGMDSLAEIPNCTPVLGDAFNYKNVEDNMFGCDAVISTLGGRDPDTDEMIDYIGNSNCIEAAGILGITRFILITSIGCGSSRKALSDEVFAVLGPVLKEKDKGE